MNNTGWSRVVVSACLGFSVLISTRRPGEESSPKDPPAHGGEHQNSVVPINSTGDGFVPRLEMRLKESKVSEKPIDGRARKRACSARGRRLNDSSNRAR